MARGEAADRRPAGRDSDRARMLDAVFEHNLSCLVLLDREFNFIRVNQAYARACRRAIDDFTGRNHFDLYPSDARAIFETVLETKRPFQATARPFSFPDQPERGVTYWDWSLVPLLDQRGEVEFLLFSLHDVSEHVRTATALRRGEERFRSLVAATAQTVWTANPRGEINADSPRAADAANGGVCVPSADEHAGWFATVHPDDRARVQAAWARAVETRTPYHAECRVREADGNYCYVATHGVPVFGADGDVREWIGTTTDITARTRVEEALRESEERFFNAFEHAAIGMALLAPDGRWLVVNRALCELVGYSAEELRSKTFQDITHPDDLESDLAHVRQLLAGEIRGYDMEKRYLHKRGDVVWILLSVSLVRDAESEPLYFVAQIQDITERKRAQEEIEQIYRYTPAGLFLFDRDYRFIRVNQRMADINGLPVEAHLGRTIHEVIPGLADRLVEIYHTVVEGGEPVLDVEMRGRTLQYPDVDRVWLSSYFPFKSESGEVIGIMGAVLEITERTRAEEQLLIQSTALAAAANAIVITDTQGRIIWVNPAFTRLTGYGAEEVIGQNPRVLKSGAQAPAFYTQLWQTICSGQVWSGELVNRRKDGTLYTEDMAIAPVEQRGAISHFIAIKQDITERKRAQKEQAALFEMAMEINQTANFNDLLDRVQRRTADLLPCDRVVTYRWDAGRAVYRAVAWYGVPDDLVADTAALAFRPGERLVEALVAGETVVVENTPAQQWIPAEIFTYFRLTALALVPLAVHGHRLGALVAHAENGGFSARQVQLLQGIAQQIAIAMEAQEVHWAQQEEAAVSAALARVGQELIALSSTPALLNRLCELTTEVLQCDYSHTWLWYPQEEVFAAVAGCGDTAEEWESIRLVKLERSVLGGQLATLEAEGMINVRLSELTASEAASTAGWYGVTVAMMVPLRRGTELLGFHGAGYRGRTELFDAHQQRIARGIAHLASLALENVRLVEALQQANHLKSDFMATMSHELRTPLNIIMGYNDLLLDESFGPLTVEQADTLRRTQQSAGKLLELINATLDIGRLETGQSPVDLDEVDVGELLGEIQTEVADWDNKPNVAVVWEVAADLPRLRTDRVKVKLAIKNLVHNALKFTEHGTVTVAAHVRDEGIEISVADTGIGIAPEVLPIIFEPFRQGESSITRRYGGVGLGLYIVRRLLALLAGTVSVDSERSRGTTFRVWLPLEGRTKRSEGMH